LDEQSIIVLSGREKHVKRRSTDADHLEGPPVLLDIDALEGRFLDWVLRMDVPPGTQLNVAQLSKDFSVATHTLQEFFSSLSRFGIVVRRPRGGWVLHGFTESYAIELSDFRNVLELNAVRHLVALPEAHPIWEHLDALEKSHLDLLDRIDVDYHDFSQLDETFHAAINGVVTNRFVKEFQKIISLVFHYHFQWNKSDERIRNENAIGEHLAYIEALRSRDEIRAVAAAKRHLATSKQTLLTSLKANSHVP
jgi:DNA-binding GntR family transcriptional regulator